MVTVSRPGRARGLPGWLARALLVRARDDENLLPETDTGATTPARPGSLRRRRLVVLATMVVGAVLLGFSLTRVPGDPAFIAATLALAGTWLLGARLSGHLSLGWWRDGRGRRRRPVRPALLIGLVAVAVFLLGGSLVALVPVLAEAVLAVLAHARWSSLAVVLVVALLNAVAEETFFRGALYHAVESEHRPRPWAPVVTTTVLYAAVTAASGNPMLIFAAVLLGLLTGLHRRATGGVLGPVLIHLVWSLGMVVLLGPVVQTVGGVTG